jgi:seryl-tRNA synthetase
MKEVTTKKTTAKTLDVVQAAKDAKQQENAQAAKTLNAQDKAEKNAQGAKAAQSIDKAAAQKEKKEKAKGENALKQLAELEKQYQDNEETINEAKAEKERIIVEMEKIASDNYKILFGDVSAKTVIIGAHRVGWTDTNTLVKSKDFSVAALQKVFPTCIKIEPSLSMIQAKIKDDKKNEKALQVLGLSVALKTSFVLKKK